MLLHEIKYKPMTNSAFQKHSGLHNWAACLVFADSVAQKKPDHLKAKFAKRGSKILIDLENCELFDTYPSFANKFVELSTVFDRFIIGVEENIKIVSIFDGTLLSQ